MTNDNGEYRPKIRDLMTESRPEELARLKIRLEREHRFLAGKPMSNQLLLAWHAYLFGYLQGGGISIPDHDQLEAMLPPLPDPLESLIDEIAEGRIFDDDDLGDCE